MLYNGADAGPQTLGLERLTPNRAYAVRGAVETGFTASPEGTASLTVTLDGRTALHIVPAAG